MKGAYILSGGEEEPELILMATGSEVELAEEAAKVLRGEGRAVRVVSMPSLEVFALQSPEYQEKVLPKSCRKRISIEALSTFGWSKYVGFEGKSNRSGSLRRLRPCQSPFSRNFGFTVERVVEEAKSL